MQASSTLCSIQTRAVGQRAVEAMRFKAAGLDPVMMEWLAHSVMLQAQFVLPGGLAVGGSRIRMKFEAKLGNPDGTRRSSPSKVGWPSVSLLGNARN